MKLVKKIIIVIFSLLMAYKVLLFPNRPFKRKNIFTFWEPIKQIPGYISLCIKTWKKFLPEYQINILDYKKAKSFIGEPLFSNIICNNLSIMHNSDAIRVALLKKYGGIWIDADTILLNDKIIKNFRKFELSMIWEEEKKFHYIALIYTKKNSFIMSEWQNKIINKIAEFKHFLSNETNFLEFNKIYKNFTKYDFLGNSIIDPIINEGKHKNFFHINSNLTKVFPELFYIRNDSMTHKEKYILFYFQKRNPQIILNILNQ